MRSIYLTFILCATILISCFSESNAQDVGVTKILGPLNLSCGTAAGSVQVIVYNYGSSSVSNIPVATICPGYSAYNLKDTLKKTIASGKQDTLTFSTTINTLSGASFTMKAFTNLSSDTKRSNDTLTTGFTILAFPNNPSVSNITSCGAGSVYFVAKSTTSGATTNWYPSNTSNKVIARGDSMSQKISSTTTYYAESVQGAGFGYDSTTFKAGNGQTGNEFDVFVNTTVNIDSFDISPSSSGSDTAEFYMKSGSFTTAPLKSSAWTYIGKSGIYSSGSGSGTVVRAKFPVVSLSGGNLYGFYIRLKKNSVNYTNGNVGDTFSSSVMKISAGYGISGLFGGTFSYRIWNGKIYYSTPACSSSRVAVTVTVSPPVKALKLSKNKTSKGAINTGIAKDPDEICVGDSLKYDISTPSNFLNAEYGTKWKLSYTMATAKNTNSTNYAITNPSSAGNGLFVYLPKSSEADSTFILTVKASNLVSGCDSIFTRYIHVNLVPASVFTVGNVCQGQATPLTNSSTPTGKINYLWRFGNGDSSAAQLPKYTYLATGTYSLSLTAYNGGCSNKTTVSVSVGAFVKGLSLTQSKISNGVFNAGTAANPDEICVGDTLIYDLGASTNFLNSDYGTKWKLTYSMKTANNTSTTNYIITNPSSTAKGAFAFLPKTNDADSTYILTIIATNLASSCDTVFSRYIHVNEFPSAIFTVGNACLGHPVTLSNNSTPAGKISYLWNFGNGDMSSSNLPVYSYPSYGTYSISLKVYNRGCSSTLTKSVSAYNTPYGSVFGKGFPFRGQMNTGDQYDPDNVCLGDTNTYTISPPKGLSNADFGKKWSIKSFTFLTPFGNSTKDTLTKLPTSTKSLQFSFFPTTGVDSVYIIKLTLQTLPGGCDTFMYRFIHVRIKPVANFGFTNACFGSPIVFKDLSTIKIATITNWLWNFGDGNTSTSQNPSHSYTQAGSYNVSLTVFSDAGCGGSTVSTVNQYPRAAVKIDAKAGCNGNVTTFTDSTKLASGVISTWKWNFGDGGSSALQNPVNTYAKSGPYTVKLVVTTGFGCKDSTTTKIRVLPKPVSVFSSLNACVGSTVYFANNSTDSVTQSSYIWDFGDGITSAQSTPAHIYKANGSYVITLKVISKNGCSDIDSQTFVPYARPDVNVFVKPGCINAASYFADSGKSGSTSLYNWSFGDGGSENSHNEFTSHIYKKSGTFSLALIITNSSGCIDSQRKSITISDNPVAGFTTADVCVDRAAVFTNSSTPAGSLNHKWDFGDGSNPETASNASHKFPLPGSYYVKLAETNASGCSDTFKKYININALPAIPHWYRNQTGYTVTFTPKDTSQAGYQWYFGTPTGDSTGKKIPTFTYPTVDKRYGVKLVVTNKAGCSSYSIDSIGMGKYGIDETLNSFGNVSIYPNPFEGSTSITYKLTVQSSVNIRISDIQGKEIAKLREGTFNAGVYTDVFDASKYHAGPGVYFLKMYINDKYLTSKIVNMK